MKWKVITAIIVMVIVLLFIYLPADVKVSGFVGKNTDYNPVKPENSCLEYVVHVVITNTGLTPLVYDKIYAGWQSAYKNIPTHTVNTKEQKWELGFLESDTLHLSSNGWTNDLFFYYQDERQTLVGDSLVYFYLTLENKGKFVSELYVAALPTLGELDFCNPFFLKGEKGYTPLKFNKQPIGSSLKF